MGTTPMLRLLPMLALLLTYPARIALEPPRDPRHPFAAVRFAAALRVADAVRTRFVLAAATIACRYPENLFGYDLLLSRFTLEQQLPIAMAAREGTRDGTRRLAATLPAALPGSGVADCAAALQSLRAADDRLVLLAERVPAR